MDFSLKRFVIEMMFYFWKRGVGPALQGFVQALVPSVLALPATFIPFLVLGGGGYLANHQPLHLYQQPHHHHHRLPWGRCVTKLLVL